MNQYIIILKSKSNAIFKFCDNDQELIQEWYQAIKRSIRANNDNLLCTMLCDDIIVGDIASYICGYKRFQILPLVNKHFYKLFNINNFDYFGVYFSDSMYFMQHFNRFYNEKENSFAIKQGLYRSFYNPEKKYNDIYINKLEAKQLLYLLISYGPLLVGGKKYDQLQREKFKKMHKSNNNLMIGMQENIQERNKKDNAPDMDFVHSMEIKEVEEEDDDEETKDDETRDGDDSKSLLVQQQNNNHKNGQIVNDKQIELQINTDLLQQNNKKINFEYEYNERVYTKMECINYYNKKEMKYIEIPSNITKLDFSRQLGANSKLVALTFGEIRDEDEDESRWVENTEINDDEKDEEEDEEENKYNEPDVVYDGNENGLIDIEEPQFSDNHYVVTDRKESETKLKLHFDVKWLCNLLLWAHFDTFDKIEILDLSHNAWNEYDLLMISDSILRRDNSLNVKQIYFDGIPFINELKKSNKPITKLFEAISLKCNKLQHLSLNHCLLRDESCKVIRNFYEKNPKTSLRIIDLINNNITERGVDILNEISVLVANDEMREELAFIVGSFYSNDINKWNMTIKTDDNYLNNNNIYK